jgi:filamentous hemagglutinin
LANGRVFEFTNGDGRAMTMLQTEGELNDISGIFEYILNPNGQVEHQLFRAGAGIIGPH